MTDILDYYLDEEFTFLGGHMWGGEWDKNGGERYNQRII